MTKQSKPCRECEAKDIQIENWGRYYMGQREQIAVLQRKLNQKNQTIRQLRSTLKDLTK